MSIDTGRWQTRTEREVSSTPRGNDPYISLINSQSILEIKGPDAEKFLQGQCSADIEQLAGSGTLAGSICTLKGRVLGTFIATKTQGRILLKMNAELIAAIREYLGKYAAFFKVELIEWPRPCILETSNPQFETTAVPFTYSLNGEEFNELLIEENHLATAVAELDSMDTALVSEADWQNRQISCGWLNLTTNTFEKYLPHQLNLDRLGAISFTKGCYTGQEIIARTEYRGKLKRRMQLIGIEGLSADTLKLPADILDTASDKTLGDLLAVSNGDKKQGLAILPIETRETTSVKIEGIEACIRVLAQPYPPEKAQESVGHDRS